MQLQVFCLHSESCKDGEDNLDLLHEVWAWFSGQALKSSLRAKTCSPYLHVTLGYCKARFDCLARRFLDRCLKHLFSQLSLTACGARTLFARCLATMQHQDVMDPFLVAQLQQALVQEPTNEALREDRKIGHCHCSLLQGRSRCGTS